ncbi:MAG: hypothetical protein ACWA5R_07985 [bacterium]
MKKVIFALGTSIFLVGAAQAVTEAQELARKGTENFGTSSISVPADTQSYSDTIVGGPTWDRPIGGGPGISSLGPVTYHSQEFSVSVSDDCDLTSVQDGFDGYIHLYQNNFDPTDQLTNLVAGDDDGAGGIGTSDLLGQSLTGGDTYFLVTSGFAAGDEGPFTNTIACGTANVTIGGAPAIIYQVPALAPWGLGILGLGLAFVGVSAARRRQS